MHDPHALSIFHRELISKLEGHVSRCYTFFERGSIYKAKMIFFSVFILLYWSWYLLKLTCLCQNLDGVVTKFSNAELLISAMKFFKSTHGIEKKTGKWPEKVAKRVNLRCQNDGHHVPRNTHRLQVGAIVFVIRHQDIAPRLVIIVLG